MKAESSAQGAPCPDVTSFDASVVKSQLYCFRQNLAPVCDTWNNYLPAVSLEPKATQPVLCSSRMEGDGTEQRWRWGKAQPEGTAAGVAWLTQGAGSCLRSLPHLAQCEPADWCATSVVPPTQCCQPAPWLGRPPPVLASRCSALPHGRITVSVAAGAVRVQQECVLGDEQMRRSNSTQKRAVVLADTQTCRQDSSLLSSCSTFPTSWQKVSPALGTGRAVHSVLSFTHSSFASALISSLWLTSCFTIISLEIQWKKSHGPIYDNAECPARGASASPPSISYSSASQYVSTAEAAFRMSYSLGVAGNGKLDGPQFMAIRQCSEAWCHRKPLILQIIQSN